MSNLISNPVDIILHLLGEELDVTNVSDLDVQRARRYHEDWKFAFTVNKKINSKKLIEGIAKDCMLFPKFRSDGSFGFNALKGIGSNPSDLSDMPISSVEGVNPKMYQLNYEAPSNDYSEAFNNVHFIIKSADVISHSFKRTETEKLKTSVEVKYKWDYAKEDFEKTTGFKEVNTVEPYDLNFYGLSEHIQYTHESKFIRDEMTAKHLQDFLLGWYCNTHTVITVKLPLSYLYAEIGDLVVFDTVLGGLKAYGEDYSLKGYGDSYDIDNSTAGVMRNGQFIYPQFMVMQTKKTLKSVALTCIQLHDISLSISKTDYATLFDYVAPPPAEDSVTVPTDISVIPASPDGNIYINDTVVTVVVSGSISTLSYQVEYQLIVFKLNSITGSYEEHSVESYNTSGGYELVFTNTGSYQFKAQARTTDGSTYYYSGYSEFMGDVLDVIEQPAEAYFYDVTADQQITSSAYTFDMELSTPQTFTIQNIGGASLDITIIFTSILNLVSTDFPNYSLQVSMNGADITDTIVGNEVYSLTVNDIMTISVTLLNYNNPVTGNPYDEGLTSTVSIPVFSPFPSTLLLNPSYTYTVPAPPTGDDCVDIDGNIYQTVQIGNQLWMAENLKTTNYRNGDPIPTGLDNSQWSSTDAGAYAVYDNNESNAATYGYLYNWYAVDDARGICPEGWHVPTDEEWMELEMALGMSESEANSSGYRGTDQGSQLAGRADLWNDGALENNANFGTSGFTGFPGGYRNSGNGYCYNMGNNGSFWSATAFSSNYAWYRLLGYSISEVSRNYYDKGGGFSVRCIKDV